MLESFLEILKDSGYKERIDYRDIHDLQPFNLGPKEYRLSKVSGKITEVAFGPGNGGDLGCYFFMYFNEKIIGHASNEEPRETIKNYPNRVV